MAFWNWERWERELDWMAISGINLPLAFTGQEYVWQKVYNELGITNEELLNFFSGPAFFAWQRMGNLQKWGGPIPQSFLDAQYELQIKILGRARAFGMKPVLTAFSGYIPEALTQHYPNVNYTRGSNWMKSNGSYRYEKRIETVIY